MLENIEKSVPGGQRFDGKLYQQMRDKEQRKKDKRSKPAPKPVPTPQVRNNSWEIDALAGIKRKGLHLDHDWSVGTWSNKTTIDERLKLLKDAGVDIRSLQRLKVNKNTAISEEVRKLIATRKQAPESVPAPVFDVASALVNVEEKQHEPFDPLFDEPPLTPPDTPGRECTPVKLESENAPNVNEDDEQGPLNYKKLCLMGLYAIKQRQIARFEEEFHRWDNLKDMVLTQIFEPCRNAFAIEPERANAPASHIVIKSFSTNEDVPASPLELNELGCTFIVEELRVLADTDDDHGTMHILEPAVTSDTERQGIKLIDHRDQTVLEGNLVALMGLLTRLSTNQAALIHKEKECFDKAGIRTRRGWTWELGAKTQRQIKDIMDALETGWEEGSKDVTVRWKGKVM